MVGIVALMEQFLARDEMLAMRREGQLFQPRRINATNSGTCRRMFTSSFSINMADLR